MSDISLRALKENLTYNISIPKDLILRRVSVKIGATLSIQPLKERGGGIRKKLGSYICGVGEIEKTFLLLTNQEAIELAILW
jgi:hypothetical protein